MSRYQYKKLYEWSDDIAYLSGLIASDGCLQKDGRHITLVSKDFEIMQCAISILNSNSKVSEKLGQYDTPAYFIQFSNVSLYDFLIKNGITPAKSKTIGEVTVPDDNYAAFLRGYFDGDGTVYGFKDKRWKNSFMYYCGFVSASAPFLYWLQSTNTRLFQTSSGTIKQNIRAMTLTYAKKDSQIIFSSIYQATPSELKLQRKYTKFKAFIDNDPYAKIQSDARVLELVDRPA